jgi:hypothetical protein
MGRIFLLAALLYGYGHASFDGKRPGALDGPAKSFHREVGETVRRHRPGAGSAR